MNPACEFVLEARGLSKTYTQGKLWQKKFRRVALENVCLTLHPGETLALVGESGCGKTTLAMCLVGLEKPDAGEILLNGAKLRLLSKSEKILARREVQLIFQDSAGALNPRLSALQIVEEPLLIRGQHGPSARHEIAVEMMERVGISSTWKHRLPHEFSGGQRQRLAIARALVLQPSVLVLDEVFVGLDLSIQGQIANMLMDLQAANRLSYICISHDLALVGQIADTIAVMHAGQIVERASPRVLFDCPEHFSTLALISARRSGLLVRAAYSGA